MSDIESPHVERVELGAFVAQRATRLQEGYLDSMSGAVAELAKLRRGISLHLGDDIELVGLTTAGLEPDDGSVSDAPTYREQAAYAALTLFALHQQSHRSKRMHRAGYSFGSSARLLRTHSGADDAVRRRFNALGTATDWNELVHHARGLIQQFRAYDVPLDYGRFARDLLSLRFPASASDVRNRWGRDFYRAASDDADSPDVTETGTAEADIA